VELHRGFVAGLIAGEGCFTIAPQNGGQSFACSFSLVQRADDLELLQNVRDSLGCGKLYPVPAYRTSKPQISWQMQSMDDCQHLAEYLDAAPLLANGTREMPANHV
jgi:LAGLIDADG endonuclease